MALTGCTCHHLYKAVLDTFSQSNFVTTCARQFWGHIQLVTVRLRHASQKRIAIVLSTYVTDIVKIEKVHKYYTKRISSISNLSYKQRLQCLKLDSLELRRLYFDMRMVYKIIPGLINVAFDDLFTFSPNRSTRGHVYKLYCQKSNLNVRSHFSNNAVLQHGTLYQMKLLHLRL